MDLMGQVVEILTRDLEEVRLAAREVFGPVEPWDEG